MRNVHVQTIPWICSAEHVISVSGYKTMCFS